MIKTLRGTQGIQELFEQTLQNKGKLLYSALVGRPVVYLAGNEFAEDYMRRRKEAEIFLKSLRFSQERVDLPQHTDYAALFKEARVARSGSIDKTILTWDDFVAIVDEKSVYGTLIKQKDNARIVQSWFEKIWAESA